MIKNDLRPPLKVSLKWEDGSIVDLTDCTVVFSMASVAVGEAIKIDREPPDIDSDPTTGKVTYNWKSGDTDEGGKFKGEFEVTFPDTKPQTFPSKENLIIIFGKEIA